MNKKNFFITPRLVAVAAGSLIAGMFLAMAFEASAFVGPSSNPANGSGAISSDAANEIVLDMIKSSHPEIVLLHAWWDGYKDLKKLRETIGQLARISHTIERQSNA